MADNLNPTVTSTLTSPTAGHTAPARVIIADDHRVLAEGLRTLLQPTYTVVGMVHSGTELLPPLAVTPADCLLLDLLMPGQHGLALVPAIRRIQPDLRIVVLTMLVDRRVAEAALAAGADAFVPKDADRHEVLGAIATVLAGGRYLSPRIPKTTHRVGLAARPGCERLTPRQETILQLLGSGKRPAQIADALGVSRSTVTFRLANLMRVLGFCSTDALLQWAVLAAPPHSVRHGTPRRGLRTTQAAPECQAARICRRRPHQPTRAGGHGLAGGGRASPINPLHGGRDAVRTATGAHAGPSAPRLPAAVSLPRRAPSAETPTAIFGRS